MGHVKNILIIAAVSVTALAACQKDPAAAVEGQYTPQSQSIQINGVIINISDWPGAAVTISRSGEGTADISVDSLLPGFDRLTVPCSVNREDKDSYTFSGEYTGMDRDIDLSGAVKNNALTLSITDIYTSPVTGRWYPAFREDGTPDLTVSFSNPMITEIPMGDTTLSVDYALEMVNGLLRSSLTDICNNAGYIGLNRNGYIEVEAMPELEYVAQYYTEPDSSMLHLYLRRTIADGAGLPVSPLDIAMRYTVSGDSLLLSMDRQTLSPWTDMLSKTVSNMTYSDYTAAGSPLGVLQEEDFNSMKSTAVLFCGVLAMTSTEYGISIALNKAD